MPPKVLQRFVFGGPCLTSWPAEITLMILRVTAGLCLALNHGFSKFPVGPDLIGGVQSAGFPFPTVSAWMAALGELVGGLLLAAGLFTRPAALWVAGVMGGAAFIVHQTSFTGEAPFGDAEMAVLYLAIAIAFIGVGSSRTGLDQLIWRRYILTGPDAELAKFEVRREALANASRREP